MDRVSTLRVDAVPSGDVSTASDAGFQTADDTEAGSTKFLSFTDDESVTPKKSEKKDVALSESTPRPAIVDSGFGAGLSPISQGDALGYNIGDQIDAKNILSGGVNIFEDCNSNDGDGLVIDDDAVNASEEVDLPPPEPATNSEKVICERNESADFSITGSEALGVNDIQETQEVVTECTIEEEGREGNLDEEAGNNEVNLQIDGKNVDALDIGNGLYLYRKTEDGELNAIQIIEEDGQSPHFKFLKVRQIGDSNLEVYEEQILEVPITNEELAEQKRKEKKEEKHSKSSHLPISDVKKALCQENNAKIETVSSKTKDMSTLNPKTVADHQIGSHISSKEINLEKKINPLKNLENSRKSPILGNFTSMTLHSSSKKEGAPPTKKMINLPLNSGRNSDAIKKTIEVSTDNSNLKSVEKTINSSINLSKGENNPIDALNISEPKKDDNNTQTTSLDVMKVSDKQMVTHNNSKENKIIQELALQSQNNSANSVITTCDLKGLDETEFDDSNNPTEAKSKLFDPKKEVNSLKSVIPNVVSKWVLRSDSIEDKSKTDKEKIMLEKPVNSIPPKYQCNDMHTKSHSKDITETVHVEENKKIIIVDSENINTEDKKKLIKDNTFKITGNVPKIKCKEDSKCKIEGPLTQASFKSDNNNLCHSSHTDRSKSIANVINFENNTSSVSFQFNKKYVAPGHSAEKNLATPDRNVKKEGESNTEFVNKYISEAFKNVPINKQKTTSDLDSHLKCKHFDNTAALRTNKPIDSNSQTGVEHSNKPLKPFGEWNEGDKQQYLNKIKEQRLPSSSPTLSPAKSYELVSAKNDMKRQESKKNVKPESFEKVYLSQINSVQEPLQPEGKIRDIDMKGLIDTTIEGLIRKTLLGPAGQPPTLNHPLIKGSNTLENKEDSITEPQAIQVESTSLYSSVKGTLGTIGNTNKCIEKKKIEIEQHKNFALKTSKIPSLLPLHNSKIESGMSKAIQDNPIMSKSGDEDDSEDEIIDSEPVTGDMEWSTQHVKDNQTVTIAAIQKMIETTPGKSKITDQKSKKDVIEAEFNKFIYTNSTSSSIPVSTSSSVTSKSETSMEKMSERENKPKPISKEKVLEKKVVQNSLFTQPHKISQNLQRVPLKISHVSHTTEPLMKTISNPTGINHIQSDNTLNYSKVQIAYQSALSDRHQKDLPNKSSDGNLIKANLIGSKINQSYSSNVQTSDETIVTMGKLYSNLENIDDNKRNDKSSVKIKHPRKQVLTPVEAPPIEVIEHADDVIQKRKRKNEPKNQNLSEVAEIIAKDLKTITPKKKYLLERMSEFSGKSDSKIIKNESFSNEDKKIDKPIELKVIPEITPKRGRGRPRKYPVEEKQKDNIPTVSKVSENDFIDVNSLAASFDESESDEEGIIRENWTMGKINDKIVCPICNKLFRTEAIVFKHVKHCSTLMKSPMKRTSATYSTGSPKRGRIDAISNESPEQKEIAVKNSNIPIEDNITKKDINTSGEHNNQQKSEIILLDTPKPNKIIVIEDSPAIDNPSKVIEKGEINSGINVRQNKSLPVEEMLKTKKVGRPRSTTTHTCEICGKIFRQLSYLVHHKLQHEKQPAKLPIPSKGEKPILSCEVCNKEFRKLHHLVEHREIHNPNTSSGTHSRKASVDKPEQKTEISTKSSHPIIKKSEEHTAGFRCEPCDKSFRKLHHLVEHRETHDGANKLKISSPQAVVVEKSSNDSPTCDVCGKSFRKLHHLIEHREQHTDTYHEKKDRKLSLIAKDIIHECSLCYMVFPNEPSLNKHFVFCQKKKKIIPVSPSNEITQSEGDIVSPDVSNVTLSDNIPSITPSSNPEITKGISPAIVSAKRSSKEIVQPQSKLSGSDNTTPDIVNPSNIGTEVKKAAKIGVPAKRSKHSLEPVHEENVSKSKDSDDDTRYMINPSYKQDSDEEREIFMNICVAKRNSLQFESPNTETGFKKRRTSLQQPVKSQKASVKKIEKLPPNVPRDLPKSKKLENKRSNSTVPSNSVLPENRVKYSFPKTTKPQKAQTKTDISTPKTPRTKAGGEDRARKVERRKSLTGIAKRKSIGKSASVKVSSNFTSVPSTSAGKKDLKKQTNHICDCGVPFPSAILLQQHTLVAHTPPRRRRPAPPASGASKLRRTVPKHSGVPVAISKPLDK